MYGALALATIFFVATTYCGLSIIRYNWSRVDYSWRNRRQYRPQLIWWRRFGLVLDAWVLPAFGSIPLIVTLGAGWWALLIPAVVVFIISADYGFRWVRLNWNRTDYSWRDYSKPNEHETDNEIQSEETAVDDGGRSDLRDESDNMPSSDTGRRLGRLSWSDIVGGLGALAATAYALGRISLALFYGELGISPEEAGWNLEKTVSGFVVIVIIVAIVVTVVTTATTLALNAVTHRVGGSLGHSHGHGHEGGGRRKRNGWTTHWPNGVALGLVISTIVLLVGLVAYPKKLADEVAHGRVPSSVLLRTLPIHPSCVEVINPKISGASSGQPLIFLGRNDGMIALFDPRRKVAVRVAAGDFQISGSHKCPDAPAPWGLF